MQIVRGMGEVTEMNVGVAFAGGGPSAKRRADDFYPTPHEATAALMNAVGQFVPNVVHEPACGDGAIARVLQRYGRSVIATDLVDRLYGESGVNYLTSPPRADAVITNPAFKTASQLIEAYATYDLAFFALLLKSTFWNAASRFDLWNSYPCKAVMPLTWRLDFTNGGSPTMDCAWYVWGRNVPHIGFQPIAKPAPYPTDLFA